MVFSNPLDAAPGINGFSAAFFSSTWDTIKEDILFSMNEMLFLATIPVDMLQTAIVLIPKKRVTEAPGDFRPIGLVLWSTRSLLNSLAIGLRLCSRSLFHSIKGRLYPGV